MRIIFQGDSITDANENMGGYEPGYVKLTRDYITGKYPGVEIINKGISGDRTINLVLRWDKDTIALHPDIVFIMIGINDIWNKFDFVFEETPDSAFKKNYEEILKKSKKDHEKIVMIEPFVLRFGAYKDNWEDEYQRKKNIVKVLAKKYADYYIPLEDMFDEEIKHTKMDTLTIDGVHPIYEGSKFISKKVIEVLEKML